jgi:hypothetical protein
MNFAFTWLFDKLVYMPKIDLEIGRVKIDTQQPEFKMWPFPVEVEKPKTAVKKTATRKAVAKKATKVVKKVK